MAPVRLAAEGDRSALIGVSLMILVALFSAVDSVIVRQLSPDIHPFVIGFTRSLFGLLAVLPWIVSRPQILRTQFRFRHVLRAALKLASLVAFFGAFASAPLADVTAIAFTAPIFVTLGAWGFLSERPQPLRVAAVACGFVGVLLVLKPGSQGGVAPGLMLALLGAVLTALIQLILKPMSARDSTETLVAWNLILTVPLAVLPALWVWTAPTPGQWALLAAQGALGALSMGLVTRAFSLAEASLLAPMDFLRLPIVAALGYAFFSQTVAQSTWIGGAVIFAASLLMARSTRSRKNREI